MPPRPAFTLPELLALTDAFTAYCAALKRPLLKVEKTPHAWLLKAWESAAIQCECRLVKEEDLPALSHRVEWLRELICPDPVKSHARVACDRDGLKVKSERNSKKIVVPTLAGVRRRGLTSNETRDRVKLVGYMAWAIHYSMREIWLHKGARSKDNIGRSFGRFHRAAVKTHRLALKLVDDLTGNSSVDKGTRTPAKPRKGKATCPYCEGVGKIGCLPCQPCRATGVISAAAWKKSPHAFGMPDAADVAKE